MSAEPNLDLTLCRAGFTLEVREHLAEEGVTALFGASGSGKTTLLRAIAGLEPAAHGCFRWLGEVWLDSRTGVNLPPHSRPLGFMFQDTRLFGHLDVGGNLAYGARRRPAVLSRTEVIEALDLAPLLGRRVAALSGGERQRVALGRTLLAGPRLLLLDEPLAALDLARKAEILPYLERASRSFGVPTVYVSHDVDEVARLADRVMVMSSGRVLLHEPTERVLERLDLDVLTGRFEAGVLVRGHVVEHDRRLHLTHVRLGNAQLAIPSLDRLAPGSEVRLRIRARDVSIATERPRGISIRNVLPGVIEQMHVDADAGAGDLWIAIDGVRLRARLTLAAVETLGLEAGMRVFALIKSASFEPER